MAATATLRVAAPGEDSGVCLSMHQPWASLLVFGIKRIEGRGWPTNHRGRLWIAATAKQPTPQEIEEMEAFYRVVHGGPLEFPAAYPTGVLLGCVEVAGCLTAEQVEGWEALPEGLKAEVGSPFCFLCQLPQRLVVPQQMRGWPKLFQLEKKLHKSAQLGLRPAPNSRGFDWAAFGAPPSDTQSLPPSQSKHKYQELQQRMDAARVESSSGKITSRKQQGSGGQAAEDGQQQRQGGKGQVAKTAACQAPRAAAAEQAQQQAQQQADPQKRLRAAQKKLRQIAALEEKQAGGQALQPEEVAKLAQRAQLEAEVAALQRSLPG